MTLFLGPVPAVPPKPKCATNSAAHAIPLVPIAKHLCEPKRASKCDLYHKLRLINEAKPIGSLPPEVLCHIFEIVTRSNSSDGRRPWNHPDQRAPATITISQVSGHWRDVALDCPLLWTCIDISPPWSFNTVCLSLSRARTCPLTINLTIPSIAFGNLLTPSTINASAGILFTIVAPHLPRCRKLVIKGDFCQLEPVFIGIWKIIHTSPMPLLEDLVIHATGVGHFATELRPSSFIHGLPLLSHLRVTSAMVQCLPPLDNLTSLHFSAGDRATITPIEFTAISLTCPLLETLAIYDDAIYGQWPLGAISFPSLRSLQIYGSFMSVSDLLRVLDAPLLDDLVIAPIAANDLDEYRKTIDDSPKFTTLKSLTLSLVNSYGSLLLVEAAQCFPTIERLTIPNIHPGSFRDIFTGVDADLLWPDLKTLVLRNVDCKSMEKLLQVAAFREAAGYPLKTLYLDLSSIQRLIPMLSMLPRRITLLESDAWSVLQDDDMLHEAVHFVGNDFDFISN